MTLGERIKAKRESLGMTQRDVAKTMDLDSSDISRYETDRNAPELDTFIRLCRALKTTPDELLQIERPQAALATEGQ